MEQTNWNNIIQGAETFAETDSLFLDSALGNWLFPGMQQKKEFGQQVALQEMQNVWNSEDERMSRMKKAGINANVAAAGIAGAGSSPSVGAPNSAVGAGASGVGSAAQLVGTGADALNAVSNAYEKFTLTGIEADKRKAETRNFLSAALHNDWLAYSISEMLPLQKANERADTYLKLANFDKAREEKQLIIKRIAEAEENITRIKNQAILYEKQGNLVESEKLKVQAQTAQIQLQNDKLQWDKDWREKYKYDNNAPIDVALEQAMVNDAPTDVVSAIGQSITDMAYNERKAINQAEIEDGYIKAYNELKAKADIDADFAPYFAKIQANKDLLIQFVKEFIENPDSIQGLISKTVNLMYMLGQESDILKGPVNNAKKPKSGVTVTEHTH